MILMYLKNIEKLLTGQKWKKHYKISTHQL
jgi:hypothetical protein